MQQDQGADWYHPLFDASGMTISELLASSNPTLAGSITHLLKVIDETDGAISAFSSFGG